MIEIGNIRVFLEREIPWASSVKLMFALRDGFGNISVLNNEGMWTLLDKKACKLPDDFKHIIIPEESLKALSNAIAEFGILPDKNKFSEDELKAVKNHLGDMQKLIFERRIK